MELLELPAANQTIPGPRFTIWGVSASIVDHPIVVLGPGNVHSGQTNFTFVIEPNTPEKYPALNWVMSFEEDGHEVASAIGRANETGPVYMPAGQYFSNPEHSHSVRMIVNRGYEWYPDEGKTVTLALAFEPQDLLVVKVELRRVEFGGKSQHTLLSDAGTPYDAPHWTASDPDQAKPICYSSGKNERMSWKANFSKTWTLPSVTFQVKAFSPNEFSIDAKPLTDLAPGGLELPPAEVTPAFTPNTVDRFDPMSITWSVSADGDNWHPIAISNNPVYVLASDSKPGANENIYHTVANLACPVGAKGLNKEKEDDIVTAIWDGFKDLDVRNESDKTMTYYGSWGTTNGLVDTLLRNGDGQCDAWANLLAAVLDTHFHGKYITQIEQPFIWWTSVVGNTVLDKHEKLADRLLIGDWEFDSISQHLNPQTSMFEYQYFREFVYLNVPGAILADNWQDSITDYVGKRYLFEDARKQVTYGQLVKGQGKTIPPGIFAYHNVVIRVKDEHVFDPSYGKEYKDLHTFRKDGITGLVKYYDKLNERDVSYDLDLNGYIENGYISSSCPRRGNCRGWITIKKGAFILNQKGE